MANAIVQAIGLSGTNLTTVLFPLGHWAGSTHGVTSVNIKAGLPTLLNGDHNLGGSISNIYTFSEHNSYLGQSDGCAIDSGGICTRTISQPSGAHRAGYISVANNADATCISWVTVSQPDGTQGAAWTGDVGYACGQRWYHSVESAGRMKEEDGGGTYVPKCMWLDADHTNGIVNAAVKFDVWAFGVGSEEVSGDASEYTVFGEDDGPIAGQPGKRGILGRPPWMTEQLVVSNLTSQSAEELCGSPTSWGPDFVGSDGRFCDMHTKSLTPLCSSQDVDGCVVVDENERIVVKRMKIERRTTSVIHKSYKRVSIWGG